MKYREHVVISTNGHKVCAEKKTLDRAGAMRLSESAIVISLDEGEYHYVYRNRIETIERFDGLYLGKHAEFDNHLGWIS